MSRKRRKKASSRSRKGAQNSAEKLVMANSGTPRASSASTIAWTPGTGIADRLAEALAPGGDQSGVIGEFLGELGRGLGERPAGVERVVPAPQVDILDEAQPRLVLGELPGEEGFGIPAVEDVADVEDDGGGPGHARRPSERTGSACRRPALHCSGSPAFAGNDGSSRQPWRALKRRLVLLMT